MLVLLEASRRRDLPFLRQLHWIISRSGLGQTVGTVIDAVPAAAVPPANCGGYTAPYRGLAAMTEADSDFFFGRGAKPNEVLTALAGARTNSRCSLAIPASANHRWRKRVCSQP